MSSTGFSLWVSRVYTIRTTQAEQAAEKAVYFVIPSEARNLSSIWPYEKKERFLASLGMTRFWKGFFRNLLGLSAGQPGCSRDHSHRCFKFSMSPDGVTERPTASSPKNLLDHPQSHFTSKGLPSMLSKLRSALVTEMTIGSAHCPHRNQRECT